MATFSLIPFLSLSLAHLLLSSPKPLAADGLQNPRQALEIIIGGGGASPSPDVRGCPPPPPYNPTPPPPSPQVLPFENERLEKSFKVIQKFRAKITGGNLKILETWRGNDVCSYTGFRCDRLANDKKDRAISGVNFNGYKFSGDNLVLKEFADELDDIAFFHSNSNFFVGGIPTIDITKQRFFYEIDLSNNRLSGDFPVELLSAKNLTFLDIRFNDFYGSVPSNLFYLDILTAIFINNNRFSSCLPDNLGITPARYLTFASNQFTGGIPRSIGLANNTMKEIVFRNNSFDGCLPYEIGFLKKAVLFDAGINQLTGPIPLSFACLEKIQLIFLAGNQFYGPVPEMVCRLPELGNFTLRNNYFTEVGPECQKLIQKKVLDVSENCIIGLPNQKSNEECAEFFSKPRQCENDKSLKYIPCKGIWYLHRYVSNPSDQNVTVSPMKTYAALTPDAH